MDLGGSKTYTLSCLNSTVPIPDPLTGQGQAVQEPAEPSQDAAQVWRSRKNMSKLRLATQSAR